MPKVPQYDSPQVQQEGLRTPQVAVEAPLEAFGGGRSANAAFSLGEDLAQKAKERADNIAQAEANTKLNTKITELMHDKQKGFLNKRGKDVYKGYDESIAGFDETAAEIEKGLVGSQKEAFRQRYASVRGDFDRSMQTHINGEMRRYEDETYKASQESELNKAISSYRDPLAVSNIVQTRRNLTLARQKSLGNLSEDGTPNEIAQAELDEVTSQTHMVVLSSLVNAGDDLAAEKYLGQNEKYFYGDDKLRAAKFVEESSRANKTMRMADQIVASSGNLSAAYKQSDKIEDGILRKAVENRVEEIFARKKALRAEGQKRTNAAIANILEQSNGDIDAIPKTLWTTLEIEDRNRYSSYAKSIREGGLIADNLELVEELETLKGSPAGQKEFLNIDLNSGVYLTELSPQTRRKLIEDKGKLSKGDKEFSKRLQVKETERSMFFREAEAAGVKDYKKQLETKKIYMQEIEDAETRNGGKPLSLEEKRAIASKMFVKLETEKTWYGSPKKKFAYEVLPSNLNLDTVDYEDIPPFALADVQRKLRAMGINNPSRQEIINKYQMDLVSMVKGNLNRGNERIR